MQAIRCVLKVNAGNSLILLTSERTNGRTNQTIDIYVHMSSTLWLQCITLTWLGYWFTTRAECCINIFQVKSNVEIRWLRKPPSQSESRQNLCISMWTCVHHICTSFFIPPCWCCRCCFYYSILDIRYITHRDLCIEQENEMDLMYICMWGSWLCVWG